MRACPSRWWGIALAVPRRLWRAPRWQDVYQRGLREMLTPLAAAKALAQGADERGYR